MSGPSMPRKRLERSSPIPSPLKSTHSPLAKSQRRQRTGTEGGKQLAKPALDPLEPTRLRTFQSKGLTLSDFIASSEETASQHEFQNEINVFIAHRVALHNSGFKYPFMSLQDYYCLLRPTHTEQSQVIYLEVLDAAQ
jgi:hypothetical protein